MVIKIDIANNKRSFYYSAETIKKGEILLVRIK